MYITVYNNLVDAKKRSKNYYDKTLNGINFREGDYVFFIKGTQT